MQTSFTINGSYLSFEKRDKKTMVVNESIWYTIIVNCCNRAKRARTIFNEATWRNTLQSFVGLTCKCGRVIKWTDIIENIQKQDICQSWTRIKTVLLMSFCWKQVLTLDMLFNFLKIIKVSVNRFCESDLSKSANIH